MSEAIIDLTNKEWKYHSIVFGLLEMIVENFSLIEKIIPVDVAVLFYKEKNINKLVGRLLFSSGNKLKFEKEHIPDKDFGNIDWLKDRYKIIKMEKILADNGDGNSLMKKLEENKNEDLNIKFTKIK